MPDVSVITGGAGGIGLATAKIVGRERLLVLCDVDQVRLDGAVRELNELGIEARSAVCDIAETDSVAALVAACSDLGRVASVIHTAGLSPSMADAETIMRVNASGTLNLGDAFLTIADDGFALVNVASMAAYTLPDLLVPTRRFKYARSDPDAFLAKMVAACKVAPVKMRPALSYCLSKRFVVWYSRTAAKDYGRRGARTVSVSPGSVDTRMGRLEERSGSGAMLETAALKRFGTAEEIAEVLAFCASEKAGYLTGTDVLVDGGVIAELTFRSMLAVGRGV